MRRAEKEIHDKKILNEILTSALICRVALFDEDYPYIVPMNYGYHDDALYFHCATDGKKIELIKRNNKVCFEIEKSHEIISDAISCKWSTKYQSIIGVGEIDIVTDTKEKINGLDIIMNQHGKSDNSYSVKTVEKVKLLKLRIKSLTGKQSD